uniref:Uncharacterized protein n=1 Tax=Cucumis melo TaxID=3656 RepID=A0A9I9CU13_CUCME
MVLVSEMVLEGRHKFRFLTGKYLALHQATHKNDTERQKTLFFNPY